MQKDYRYSPLVLIESADFYFKVLLNYSLTNLKKSKTCM